jgi:hypothetical protein
MRTGGLIAAGLFAAASVVSVSIAQEGAGSAVPAGEPGVVSTADDEDVGVVKEIEGPAGSVLVLRGNQTYSLAVGDLLFSGDQVFTRTNGKVRGEYYECELNLDSAESRVIEPDCAIPPVELASASVVGGVTIGTGAAAGAVGATPFVLPGLLAAGGVTALEDSST